MGESNSSNPFCEKRKRVLCLVGLVGFLLFAGCSFDTTNPPVLVTEPSDIQLVPGDTLGSFQVVNGGQGTLSWTLQEDAPWLRLDRTQGVTTTTDRIDYKVIRDSLHLGPVAATVRFESNGGSGTVLIRMWNALGVSLTDIDLGSDEASAVIGIENLESDPLPWKAGVDQSWLKVNPNQGSIGRSATSVTVSADRAGLVPGPYTGTLHVDAGARGYETVVITMSVPSEGLLSGLVSFAGTRIPVVGARVKIGGMETVTGEAGTYVLTGVPVGEWQLEVLCDGFDLHTEPLEVWGQSRVHDIEITSDSRTGRLTGVITNSLGDLLDRAVVTVLNPNGSKSELWMRTVEGGAYLLDHVPQGTRTIRYERPLYEPIDVEIVLQAGEAAVDQELRAAPLWAPGPEGGPDLTRAYCSQVRIEWERGLLGDTRTVKGYRVERAQHVGGPFEDVSGLLEGQAISSFIDDGLELGEYYYRTSADNIDDVQGVPSAPRRIMLHPWALLHNGLLNGPHVRWGHTAIYDSYGGDSRLVLFGGAGCISGLCGPPYGDVYSFDLSEYAWEQIAPEVDDEGWPAGRRDHTSVVDAARNRMVVFGGRDIDSNALNDVWAFDLASHTWTELWSGVDGPAPRYGHVAVYDPAGDRMIMHGGLGAWEQTDQTTLNDVWNFDLASRTWTRLR